MRKIVLSLMILLTLCGVSYADFVYATSSGSLGTLKVNASNDMEASPSQYTGNMSSPFLASYWNGNSTSLVLIDRYAGLSGDKAYVFSPNSLTNYTNSADIVGVHGTEGAEYSENGYSLFLTSGAEIYEVSTGDFRVLNSYDCTRIISNDTYSTEIVDIVVDSQLVQVIASTGEASRFIRFDGQLDETRKFFMSRDVSSGASSLLSTLNGYPVVGHSLGIDTMSSNGKEFYRVISTDYPVKAMCPDESSGIFYATQYKDGNEYVNTISHAASSTNFTPITIRSSSTNIKLIRDNSHLEIFAAMTDEGINVITYKDGKTSKHSFTSSELGGKVAGIVAASVSGYDWTSSSSGCDASGFGLMMVAAVMFMMRRK